MKVIKWFKCREFQILLKSKNIKKLLSNSYIFSLYSIINLILMGAFTT